MKRISIKKNTHQVMNLFHQVVLLMIVLCHHLLQEQYPVPNIVMVV
uniref:Uncharacterized protein n=1 Tax=Schistosoma japonicum TaxID=6182 RepID=Q5C197_SCHJA|nr:unknown [Schistosoma japonicum]